MYTYPHLHHYHPFKHPYTHFQVVNRKKKHKEKTTEYRKHYCGVGADPSEYSPGPFD